VGALVRFRLSLCGERWPEGERYRLHDVALIAKTSANPFVLLVPCRSANSGIGQLRVMLTFLNLLADTSFQNEGDA